MSELKDLMDIPETITLSNGKEFKVFSVTLGDEAKFARMQQDKLFVESLTFLVKQAIKYAYPDVTDSEIEHLNKKDLQLITKAVLKKNGLEFDSPEDSEKNLVSP